MLVAGLAQQAAAIAQQADERTVGVHPELAGHIRHVRQEATTLVERKERRDAGGLRDTLVVFTVGRGLVDDAGSIAGGDVVVDQDLPRVLSPPGLGIRVVVEQSVVGDGSELRAQDAARDRRAGILDTLVAEVLRVAGEQVFGQQVFVRGRLDRVIRRSARRAVHVGRAVRTTRNDHVPDVGTDREREVRRQGPRGRRPGERPDRGEPESFGLRTDQREGHRDRGILAHLVDVVVHAQLVARQRRLVAPAVR